MSLSLSLSPHAFFFMLATDAGSGDQFGEVGTMIKGTPAMDTEGIWTSDPSLILKPLVNKLPLINPALNQGPLDI